MSMVAIEIVFCAFMLVGAAAMVVTIVCIEREIERVLEEVRAYHAESAQQRTTGSNDE